MSRHGFLRAVLVATAFLGLAGCGGAPQVAAGNLPRGIAAGAADAVSPDYLIGPGDSLEIFVWDHPDLTTTVTVGPDGKITARLVEDLQAAGNTRAQLGALIEQKLSEYITAPVVTVIVQSFVGDPSQQVRVVGQATQPQALQYRQGMTVLDVLIAVGGLSEFASGNRARLIRNVNGTLTEIKVRLDDLLNGEIEHNERVLPGDVLVIPESIF